MNQGDQPCKTPTFCPDLNLCPVQTCYEVCKDSGNFLRSVFASLCVFWLDSSPEGATMKPLDTVCVSKDDRERMWLKVCLPAFGINSLYLQAEELRPRLSHGQVSFCTHLPCKEFYLHHKSQVTLLILHEQSCLHK